jgi:hypothetical protein
MKNANIYGELFICKNNNIHVNEKCKYFAIWRKVKIWRIIHFKE